MPSLAFRTSWRVRGQRYSIYVTHGTFPPSTAATKRRREAATRAEISPFVLNRRGAEEAPFQAARARGNAQCRAKPCADDEVTSAHPVGGGRSNKRLVQIIFCWGNSECALLPSW